MDEFNAGRQLVQVVPTDAVISGAEVYPKDEQLIELTLTYCNDEDGGTREKRSFYIARDAARSFAENILDVLSAPDVQTAWANIVGDELSEEDFEAVSAGATIKGLKIRRPSRKGSHDGN